MRMIIWDKVQDVVNDYTPVMLADSREDVLRKVDAELQAFGIQLVFCGSMVGGRSGWFKVERIVPVEPRQLELGPLAERDGSCD